MKRIEEYEIYSYMYQFSFSLCNFCIFQKYLAEFGYISQRQVEQGAQSLMAVDISEAIKKLQRMGGITPTGVLDIRTQELMHKPRCGVKDPVEEEGSRKKRYVLAPSKWDHKDLTYRYVQKDREDHSMLCTKCIISNKHAIRQTIACWSYVIYVVMWNIYQKTQKTPNVYLIACITKYKFRCTLSKTRP